MTIDIEGYLKEQLENIDIEALIKEEIRKTIKADIERGYKKIVLSKIDEIIDMEIEIVMSGEIHTDDGWGNKNNYGSFEDMFKKEFRERLDKSWEMKKTIERHVNDRVTRLFKSNIKEVADKIAIDLIGADK